MDQLHRLAESNDRWNILSTGAHQALLTASISDGNQLGLDVRCHEQTATLVTEHVSISSSTILDATTVKEEHSPPWVRRTCDQRSSRTKHRAPWRKQGSFRPTGSHPCASQCHVLGPSRQSHYKITPIGQRLQITKIGSETKQSI